MAARLCSASFELAVKNGEHLRMTARCYRRDRRGIPEELIMVKRIKEVL
jgi:hypothetical protein